MASASNACIEFAERFRPGSGGDIVLEVEGVAGSTAGVLVVQQRHPGPLSEKNATKRYEKLSRALDIASMRVREASNQ